MSRFMARTLLGSSDVRIVPGTNARRHHQCTDHQQQSTAGDREEDRLERWIEYADRYLVELDGPGRVRSSEPVGDDGVGDGTEHRDPDRAADGAGEHVGAGGD